MSDIALGIQNLKKTYVTKAKTIKALDDVSIDIPKGSFFGLLGPNGAGKTTLINILATLVKKDSGVIKVFGQDFDQDVISCKYHLGIVPQEIVIDPFFTVREALDIYAGYFGIKKQDRRTDEIIEVLGLSDKKDSQPRSLSGGMRRRLLIAKSLVHNPEILILDEPTAGVDVELREQLWQYVVKLNKQGKTIILTTHYLEEAEKLCDHVAIINKGKIIANDRKENLKKLFGEKKFNFTFAEVNKKLLKKLAKYGSVQEEKNNLTLSFKSDGFSYSDLIKDLANENIKNISTEEPDIEDIFKNLIYKAKK